MKLSRWDMWNDSARTRNSESGCRYRLTTLESKVNHLILESVSVVDSVWPLSVWDFWKSWPTAKTLEKFIGVTGASWSDGMLAGSEGVILFLRRLHRGQQLNPPVPEDTVWSIASSHKLPHKRHAAMELMKCWTWFRFQKFATNVWSKPQTDSWFRHFCRRLFCICCRPSSSDQWVVDVVAALG